MIDLFEMEDCDECLVCGETDEFEFDLNVKKANGKEISGPFCNYCAEEISESCIPELRMKDALIIIQLEWKRPSYEYLNTVVQLHLPRVLIQIIIDYYSDSSNFMILKDLNFDTWKRFEQDTYRAHRCRAMVINSEKEINAITNIKFQTPSMSDEEWCQSAWQTFKSDHEDDKIMEWMQSAEFLKYLMIHLRSIVVFTDENYHDNWFERPLQIQKKRENIRNEIQELETRLISLQDELKRSDHDEDLLFLRWSDSSSLTLQTPRRINKTCKRHISEDYADSENSEDDAKTRKRTQIQINSDGDDDTR